MHDLPSPDDEHHPYSLVRVVDGTAWCAGVLPYGPDGALVTEPEAAVDAALQTLQGRLQAAGSDLQDVVQVTAFLTDLSWRPTSMPRGVVDDAVQATTDACGAPQTGHPNRILIEATWLDEDGTAVTDLDAVLPAGWREGLSIRATSSRGTAVCTYPPGSDVLACEYENPGHGPKPGPPAPTVTPAPPAASVLGTGSAAGTPRAEALPATGSTLTPLTLAALGLVAVGGTAEGLARLAARRWT